MLSLKKIVLLCLATKFVVQAALEVTLVHTNDIHTRFEETDENGNVCTEELLNANRCYGGIARRATAIRNFRENDPNVLLLDAGDQFQGPTLWFYVYKGMATAHFMELLEYNVMVSRNFNTVGQWSFIIRSSSKTKNTKRHVLYRVEEDVQQITKTLSERGVPGRFVSL